MKTSIREDLPMRNPISLLCVAFVALVLAAGTSVAANTHVIVATDDLQWSYNGQKSPLISVDDLKKGDTVEIQVSEKLDFLHGFVTIRKIPPPITPIEDPVLKCGEAASAKPNAVLKEDCAPGAVSKFGKTFKGSMKLIVLEAFKEDVPFWCVKHMIVMQGVLKLQAANSK
jgi:hypothetical protein